SRSRADIQHEIPGAVVDANVIIIRGIVGSGYVVGYFGSGHVVGQEESPKLGEIYARCLSGSGMLAAGYKEWQSRGAPAPARCGNGDRPWAVRDADVRARAEGAEHRSVTARPDQDLPVGRCGCRSQTGGSGEVGDSIRGARNTATAGVAASPG